MKGGENEQWTDVLGNYCTHLVFLSICLHGASTSVCTGVHMLMEARGQCQVSFLMCCLLGVFEPMTCNSSHRLSWLASKPQCPASSYLLSTGLQVCITMPDFFFLNVGSGDWNSSPMLCTNWIMVASVSPQAMLLPCRLGKKQAGLTPGVCPWCVESGQG